MTPNLPSIILTRPALASEEFARQLRRQLGFAGEIIISPLLKIELANRLPDLDRVKGLIFTSRNGVDALIGLTDRRDLPCWCVGSATCLRATQAGMTAVHADGDAKALIRRILADAPRGPLLHIRGQRALGEVAQTLTTAGIETDDAVVYQQVAQKLSAQAIFVLQRENPVILPLFSPNTARQFASQGPFNAPLNVLAISENAAREVLGLQPNRLLIAQKPDAASMLQRLNTLIAAD